MRTKSEFMDKQIMELSRSYSDDFSQLTYPQPHHHLQNDNNDDDLLSGLHLRHTVQPQQQSRASTLGNRGSTDQVGREDSRDSVLISVIDRKMSQHFGNLLHAVESISARVSQMETRLGMVENSVDDLKGCTDVNYGKTDGKLREVENILRKLEGGMQDLTDKQEIAEAQLQLAKLQMAKDHEKLEQEKSIIQTILASAPQQTHRSYSAPPVVSAQHPSLTDNASTPAHQNFPPAPPPAQPPAQSYSTPHVASVQHPSLPKEMTPALTHQNYPPAPPPAQLSAQPSQLSAQPSQYQNPYSQQPDSNYSAPPLNPPPPPQAYNYMSQDQQSQPPPTAPYQPYQAGPHPSQTSHGQQQNQLHQPLNAPDPQTQYSTIHNPAEIQCAPSQSYPQSIHRPSDMPGAILPLQHFDGSMQYAPDRHSRNYRTDFSAGNVPPVQHSGYDDYYSHGRSSHYNDSKIHQSNGSPSSSASSGGNSFSRLPTAKVLPYPVSMAASMDKESNSGGTGNRVPVDNVIDKVVSMGFRRDVVRATVRKMTENGQSVDLNVVLDKLMNSGEVQSQSGLYDR